MAGVPTVRHTELPKLITGLSYPSLMMSCVLSVTSSITRQGGAEQGIDAIAQALTKLEKKR